MKEHISLDGMKTFGPYTPGIKHGQTFWLSGQIAIDGRDDIKSVSYTHLTLPTIYSV